MFNIEDYLNTANDIDTTVDPDKIIYYSPNLLIDVFDRDPKLVLIYAEDGLDIDVIQTEVYNGTILATVKQDTTLLYAFYLDGSLYKFVVHIPSGTEVELDEDLIDSKDTFRSLLVTAFAEYLDSGKLLKAVLNAFMTVIKTNL